MSGTFLLDGVAVPFVAGQSVLQAALAAGRYIPHLCYHPEFRPHGSCKLCTATVQGRLVASCTTPATADLVVQSNTDELREIRRTLVQMLFAEGNHFCPSCEKSGNCQLQALGSDLGVTTAGFRTARSTPRTRAPGSTSIVACCASCACVRPPRWTARTSSPSRVAGSPST